VLCAGDLRGRFRRGQEFARAKAGGAVEYPFCPTGRSTPTVCSPATKLLIGWWPGSESNQRHADFQSIEGSYRYFQINHLRRLPTRIPGTSRHTLVTSNLTWAQIQIEVTASHPPAWRGVCSLPPRGDGSFALVRLVTVVQVQSASTVLPCIHGWLPSPLERCLTGAPSRQVSGG